MIGKEILRDLEIQTGHIQKLGVSHPITAPYCRIFPPDHQTTEFRKMTVYSSLFAVCRL